MFYCGLCSHSALPPPPLPYACRPAFLGPITAAAPAVARVNASLNAQLNFGLTDSVRRRLQSAELNCNWDFGFGFECGLEFGLLRCPLSAAVGHLASRTTKQATRRAWHLLLRQLYCQNRKSLRGKWRMRGQNAVLFAASWIIHLDCSAAIEKRRRPLYWYRMRWRRGRRVVPLQVASQEKILAR